MLKTEKRVIGGLEVTTTQLPCRRAFALFARVGKVLGPALGDLDATTLTAILSKDTAAIAGPLGKVFTALDTNDATDLACEVLAFTSVLVKKRGQPDQNLSLDQPEMIDIAFAGKLRVMLMAMWFALEVNYRDFFVEPAADGEPAEDAADEQEEAA